MINCGLVLLAAGASRRLGEAKQLLGYNNDSFLSHSINIALQSRASPVVVVYGANAGAIGPHLKETSAHVVFNPCWEEGMASSIRAGLSAMLQLSPSATGVIFMVCDQPYVTTSLLNTLIKTNNGETGKIVACHYANTYGAPALFGEKYFAELLGLNGEQGAKKVIKRHAAKVTAISFPMGHIDIDTREDYEMLNLLTGNIKNLRVM